MPISPTNSATNLQSASKVPEYKAAELESESTSASGHSGEDEFEGGMVLGASDKYMAVMRILQGGNDEMDDIDDAKILGITIEELRKLREAQNPES